MIGKLHLIGYGLLIGGIGQYGYVRITTEQPMLRKLSLIVFLPWITVFVLTLCQRPPCGVRIFRRWLAAALGMYVTLLCLIEIMCVISNEAKSHSQSSLVLERGMMYSALLSVALLLRAFLLLKQRE